MGTHRLLRDCKVIAEALEPDDIADVEWPDDAPLIARAWVDPVWTIEGDWESEHRYPGCQTAREAANAHMTTPNYRGGYVLAYRVAIGEDAGESGLWVGKADQILLRPDGLTEAERRHCDEC